MAYKKISQKTHLLVSKKLVGEVDEIKAKFSRVSLLTNEEMKADNRGLIHGGFTFGLADYAAMVAINDPFVVLQSAEVMYLKPVVLGDKLVAKAAVIESQGNR